MQYDVRAFSIFMEEIQENKPFKIDSTYINKRFKVMDTVHEQLTKLWDDNYQAVVKKLERYDENGNELNEVNINIARRKSYLVAQFMAQIFLYKYDFFRFRSRCADDIESSKAIQEYAEYIISQIPHFDELGYKWLLQGTIKGFSPAKMLPIVKNGNLQKLKFFPVHTNDLRLDPTWAFGMVKDLFHEIRLTEEDLLDLGNKYNREEIKKFIEEVKNPTPPDPREKNLEKDKQSIPKEQHEGEYIIREYWFAEENKDTGNNDWYLQVWGIDGNGEASFKIRPADPDEEYDESPFWMGHPFIFGVDNPALYSLTGYGEPNLVKSFQVGATRIINQIIDGLDIALNPILMISKRAYTDEADLAPLKNPRQNKLAILDQIGTGATDWFPTPQIPPGAQWALNYLAHEEQKELKDMTLSGETEASVRPATTSLMNRDAAMDSINFRAWVVGWAFKEFAKKLLITIQQYGSEEDIIRVAGKKGYSFIKLDNETRKDKNEPLMIGKMRTRKEEWGEEYTEKTIRLRAGKKEALKFYDIEVVTKLEETPEMLAKRGIEALTLVQNVPELKESTDVIRLGRQIYEFLGFKDVDELIPEADRLTPRMSRLLAKVPPQLLFEVLQKAGALDKMTEETVPKELKSVLEEATKMKGVSQPVANKSNEMRSDRV